jgi:ArsR family transcriptional regulator
MTKKKNVDAVMPAGKKLDALGDFFKALTDGTRLKILYTLAQKEYCVVDLAQALGAEVSSVSRHLSLLKARRLVKGRRDGRTVMYSLDDDHVGKILEFANAHLSEAI